MLKFLCFIINYNFVLYVMFITHHLHVVKDFWTFEIVKTYIEFLKNSNFINFTLRVFFEFG
jgi:hypothetical protein